MRHNDRSPEEGSGGAGTSDRGWGGRGDRGLRGVAGSARQVSDKMLAYIEGGQYELDVVTVVVHGKWRRVAAGGVDDTPILISPEALRARESR